MSKASVDALPQGSAAELDAVSVQTHQLLMLSMSFEHPALGTLILTAAAHQATLGELLLHARITASKLDSTLASL